MINRAAISNVRTDLKKYDADAHITNKQIYTILNKHSKWLLKRESDTFRLARINRIYQEYKCAEVIDVPKIDPCCGIVTKCTIKRTKSKIPDLYEDILGVLIKRVTSIDGSTEISPSTVEDYVKRKNNPWSKGKDSKFFFYKDGYLYGDLPKKINIVGLYERNIDKFNTCSECPEVKECKRFLDEEWYVPDYLEAQIIDFTVKELSLQLQIPAQEKIDKNENKP
jgi:hypothetical protein